jgi:hypothetical protein
VLSYGLCTQSSSWKVEWPLNPGFRLQTEHTNSYELYYLEYTQSPNWWESDRSTLRFLAEWKCTYCQKHFLQYHTEFGQSGILLKNHEKTLKYAQNVRMLIEIHLRWQVAFLGCWSTFLKTFGTIKQFNALFILDMTR